MFSFPFGKIEIGPRKKVNTKLMATYLSKIRVRQIKMKHYLFVQDIE